MSQSPLAHVLTQLAVQSNVANSQSIVAALASTLQSSSNQISNTMAIAKEKSVAAATNHRSESLTKTRQRSRSPSLNSSVNGNRNNRTSTTAARKRSPSRSPSYHKHSTYSSSKSTLYSKPSSSSSSSSYKYAIRLPKHLINSEANNVISLKSHYAQLYIPSEFASAKNSYLSCLPIHRPLKFNQRCLFHIMRKEASSICENQAVYDPPDADHSWNVKVMLLAMPNMDELFKRSTQFAQETWKEDRYEHPSKVIQFLVGNKGKHELMALGGPWSKSLDGLNPATNNQTLINTAIRTVRSLSGIDLTPCTQWFRFLDIQYNRNEEIRTVVVGDDLTDAVASDSSCVVQSNDNDVSENVVSGGGGGATLSMNDDKAVETTVIFLPNVWSLMPTSLEYQKILEAYTNFIHDDPDTTTTNTTAPSSTENTNPQAFDGKPGDADGLDTVKKQTNNEDEKVTGEEDEQSTSEHQPPQTSSKDSGELSDSNVNANESSNITIDSLMQQTAEEEIEATHYSKIDLKKIKVDELRLELMARKLDPKGLKAQLLNRLKEALEKEKLDDDLNDMDQNELIVNTQMDTSLSDQKEAEETSNNSFTNPTNFNQMDEEKHEGYDENDHGENQTAGDKTQNTANNDGEKIYKNQVSTSSNSNQNQPKPLKFSKHELEKMYKLPPSPHIIVHPSSSAKSSKFDCQLVSLSHLLDYRKEDNKESSFEVSLFAECFNEMLIRDHGFVIYKHLVSIKANKDLGNKRRLSEAKDDDSEAKKLKQTDETSNGESSKNNNVPKSSEQQILPKPKPKTIYPELLLAFTYYDTNRTNYIHYKDLEDLLILIGLNLTRSKIRFILDKFDFKDNLFNYRHLTDSSTSNKVYQVEYKLPTDDEIIKNILTFDSYMKRLTDTNSSKSLVEFDKDAGLIELNGTTIDVLNTIKKLEKSESNVNILDQKLKDTLNELDRVKVINKNLERQKQKTNDELTDYKKKLKDQERSNRETYDKYSRFKDCIYRSKSQLGKLFDDMNEVIKRGQIISSNGQTSCSTSADAVKNVPSEATDLKNADESNKEEVLGNSNNNNSENLNIETNDVILLEETETENN